MADKETVIIDNTDRTDEVAPVRRSNGWVGLLIALILIVLFFMFGGFSLFNGQSATPTTTTPTTTAPTGTYGQ